MSNGITKGTCHLCGGDTVITSTRVGHSERCELCKSFTFQPAEQNPHHKKGLSHLVPQLTKERDMISMANGILKNEVQDLQAALRFVLGCVEEKLPFTTPVRENLLLKAKQLLPEFQQSNPTPSQDEH